MTLLFRLREKSRFLKDATATVATVATVEITVRPHELRQVPCVAEVASVAVASAEIQKAQMHPDRYCWPHSDAMNTGEIRVFQGRLVRFTAWGLSHEEANRLADKLIARDREGDDRRLCLECDHLRGVFCRNYREAHVGDHLPRDLVKQLQRCPGFSPELHSPLPTT
jgi:hypothetical protein